MKRTHFYGISICIAICLLFFGCEQSITNVTFPFEEKIVIQGIIEANKPIDNIAISRNIPTLSDIANADLLLPDAKITLRVDNQTYTPTVRFDSAFYKIGSTTQSVLAPIYSFRNVVAQAGKTYQIRVQWQGKTAFCETTVPDESRLSFTNGYRYFWTPQIIPPSSSGGASVTIGTILTVEAQVLIQPEYCYKLTFYAKEPNRTNATNDSTIFFIGNEAEWFVLPKGINQNANSVLRAIGSTSRFPELSIDFTRQAESLAAINARVQNGRYTAVLTAATIDYYQWYNSRFEGRSSPDPFSIGGQNIYSNIQGDGIGIIAAAAAVEIPLSVR